MNVNTLYYIIKYYRYYKLNIHYNGAEVLNTILYDTNLPIIIGTIIVTTEMYNNYLLLYLISFVYRVYLSLLVKLLEIKC